MCITHNQGNRRNVWFILSSMLLVIVSCLLLPFPIKAQNTEPANTLLWKYDTDEVVSLVSLNADGSFIVAGSDKDVYFLDRQGTLLWRSRLGESVERIESVEVSADGSHVAAGFRNGSVYFFDWQGNIVWKYRIANELAYIGVAISADGSRVVAVSEVDYNVRLLDKQGRLLWKTSIGAPAYSVKMTSDDSRILVQSDDGYYVLDGQGELIQKYSIIGEYYETVSVYFKKNGNNSLGEYGLYDTIYDAANGRIATLSTKRVTSLAISDNALYAVVGADNSSFYLLDEQGHILWKYPSEEITYGYDISDVAISADGSYVAAAFTRVYFLSSGIESPNSLSRLVRTSINTENKPTFTWADLTPVNNANAS